MIQKTKLPSHMNHPSVFSIFHCIGAVNGHAEVKQVKLKFWKSQKRESSPIIASLCKLACKQPRHTPKLSASSPRQTRALHASDCEPGLYSQHHHQLQPLCTHASGCEAVFPLHASSFVLVCLHGGSDGGSEARTI